MGYTLHVHVILMTLCFLACSRFALILVTCLLLIGKTATQLRYTDKIQWFDSLEVVKHSKGDSMDYIVQFRLMNPHQ